MQLIPFHCQLTTHNNDVLEKEWCGIPFGKKCVQGVVNPMQAL